MEFLTLYSTESIAARLSERDGETKLGQCVCFAKGRDYASLRDTNAKYALIGIPEDIGPRANCGRGGAESGWNAFISSFLNLQSNSYLSGQQVVLLGHIDCNDLQARSRVDCCDNDSAMGAVASGKKDASIETLRGLVDELDDRVSSIISSVLVAGLTPLVIGGGHNNCFPLMRALSSSIKSYSGSGISVPKVGAINLDPHADFRRCGPSRDGIGSNEGRHSGNGFRAAYNAGILSAYHIVGLHEQKNNAEALAALHAAGSDFSFDTYQDLFLRGHDSRHCGTSAGAGATVDAGLGTDYSDGSRFNCNCANYFRQQICRALERMTREPQGPNSPLGFGVELDMDALTMMPASAFNAAGVSAAQAAEYVHIAAGWNLQNTSTSSVANIPASPWCGDPPTRPTARYLHLCEAAPRADSPTDVAVVGQVLSLLVCTFIQAQQASVRGQG